MAFPDEPQGAETPSSETAPHLQNELPAEHPELSSATERQVAETHSGEAALDLRNELPPEHSDDTPTMEPHGAEIPTGPADPHVHDELPPEHSSEPYVVTGPDFSGHEVSGEVLTETGSHDDWSSGPPVPEPVSLTPAPPHINPPPPAWRPAPPPPEEPSIFGRLGGLLGGSGTPPKPPGSGDEEDEEEDGMARMSFLEHLEELRKRLILAMAGVGVAFILCLLFSDQLWSVVFEPAGAALRALKVVPPELHQISPMDTFQIFWMKVPILFAVFLSSPWVLYQVWAFISPGLYKKERRYAVPFVLSSAGLFIVGGLFAYYIAFRYGLEFLLGLGIGKGVAPTVSVTEYYDLFVDVMLGVGIVFEIPVLLFLLTLLHIASPAFLVRHSRYAILAIVILAAFITPTGDVFNLTLFATPMILLFYVGIFASYILVLRREKRRFPWGTFLKWLGIVLLVLAVVSLLVAKYYGYHVVMRWPIYVK